MSQSTDLTISNQLMPNARTEINSIFGAIGSNHKGGSRPSYVLTGMTWIDDTSTPWAYNLYDGAGDITFMEFNPTGDTVNLVSVVDVEAGGSAGVVIKNSGGTTVATLGSANTTNVTFAGTVNIDEIGTLTTQLSVVNGGTGLDALGTAGQMLKVNAGGTALEYVAPAALLADAAADIDVNAQKITDLADPTNAQDAATKAYVDTAGGGGWVPLSTQTVSVAVASVDFTSGIDSTYKAYAVVFDSVIPVTDDRALWVRIGNGGAFDSGASNYGWVYDYSRIGAAAAIHTETENDTEIEIIPSVSSDAGSSANGVIILFNPANAADFTRLQYDCAYAHSDNSSLGRVKGSGNRKEAAAHDRIQFLFSSGNIASGTFTLYGLAGA